MIVSNKQISIAIISLFFAVILAYFFLWFGYVEIFINHVEVENFQVKSREKIYECSKNPCRIKLRAGKKFTAQIDHSLAENKTIFIAKIPLLKTEKVIIQAKKELPEAELNKISRDFLRPKTVFKLTNVFGPVLYAKNGNFAIFSQKSAKGLQIYIKNKKSIQLLTTVEDEFSLIMLERNFSLSENGIVIPAKNLVYYYDFATQRKSAILEINSLQIADISVSKDGSKVIFYNLKEKAWQKFFTNSNKSPLLLGDGQGEVFFAGFWEDQEIFVKNNVLYLDGQKSQKIPLEILPSDKFSIRGNNLIIEQDFEVWEVKLR